MNDRMKLTAPVCAAVEKLNAALVDIAARVKRVAPLVREIGAAIRKQYNGTPERKAALAAAFDAIRWGDLSSGTIKTYRTDARRAAGIPAQNAGGRKAGATGKGATGKGKGKGGTPAPEAAPSKIQEPTAPLVVNTQKDRFAVLSRCLLACGIEKESDALALVRAFYKQGVRR